jgi:hypothetical protein
MLLLKLVGVSAAIPHHTIGAQLACTVLLPLFFGQVCLSGGAVVKLTRPLLLLTAELVTPCETD